MPDEGKLRQQAERGQRAEQFLENELLKEAFEKVEQEIREGFENSEGDEGVLRNAYYLHRSLESLKQKIRQIVITGNNARTELENEQKGQGSHG